MLSLSTRGHTHSCHGFRHTSLAGVSLLSKLRVLHSSSAASFSIAHMFAKVFTPHEHFHSFRAGNGTNMDLIMILKEVVHILN